MSSLVKLANMAARRIPVALALRANSRVHVAPIFVAHFTEMHCAMARHVEVRFGRHQIKHFSAEIPTSTKRIPLSDEVGLDAHEKLPPGRRCSSMLPFAGADQSFSGCRPNCRRTCESRPMLTWSSAMSYSLY